MRSKQRRSVGFLAAAFSVASLVSASVVHADTVYGWGYNSNGQLGDGTTVAKTTPTLVTGLSSVNITSVAAGGGTGYALTSAGQVYAWGNNVSRQLADGQNSGFDFTNHPTPALITTLGTTPVSSIVAGNASAYVLQSGSLTAWGGNSSGQLGNGATSFGQGQPSTATGLTAGVTRVGQGYTTGYAIQNGGLYAFGANSSGQIGNGTTTSSSTPVAVTGLGSGVTSVAGGQSFTVAVQNGAAFATGGNGVGQLGNGTTTNATTFSAVTGLSSGVTAVAAGNAHALAIVNGSVYAWGYNSDGQLGNGTAGSGANSTPTLVNGISGTVVQIAAGAVSSYALTSTGSLYVWGDNAAGQLGLGSTVDSLTPTLLAAPAGSTWTSVSAGLASSGSSAFVLATAVPEPASVAVLGLAAGMLGRRRRRA